MKAGYDHVRNQQQIFISMRSGIWRQRSPDHDPYIRNVQVCHDKISDMEERMGAKPLDGVTRAFL